MVQVKCHQYWPKDEFKIYGDFKVTVVKQEIIAKCTTRTFILEKVTKIFDNLHHIITFICIGLK